MGIKRKKVIKTTTTTTGSEGVGWGTASVSENRHGGLGITGRVKRDSVKDFGL